MDTISLLWQMGVLSVLLIFGVKIGLAMGFSGISKKIAAVIITGYALGIYLFSMLAVKYLSSIQEFFTQYITLITLIMAVVIIWAGFHTIKEWKESQQNTAKATCVAMIAPCPCCFGAIISVVVLSPVIGLSSATIGQYSAIFLAILITIFYLASGYIVKFTKKPYPVLLGNFMLFAGLYFLGSAIIIPNISSVLSQKMSMITVPSLWTFMYIAVSFLFLIAIGIVLNRKRSSFI